MRLICPNCEAQYEVDPSQIPSAGRDVQCSNCEHSWFQGPVRSDMPPGGSSFVAERNQGQTDLAPDAPINERAGSTSAAVNETFEDSSQLPRRPLDPKVANILREEAELEAAARRWEGAGDGLRSDGESGPEQTGVEPPHLRKESPASGDNYPDASVSDIGDIDVLPDLRKRTKSTEKTVAKRRTARRRGFRVGFVLAAFAVAIGTTIQSFAPEIMARYPQAGPYIAAYVEWADQARALLDDAKIFLLARLGEIIEIIMRLIA